jgi:tetratricopeptide (TPR) repeat protein
MYEKLTQSINQQTYACRLCCIMSLTVAGMYMHGNKEQAIRMLEKLAKDLPGSHAVAFTHMELLCGTSHRIRAGRRAVLRIHRGRRQGVMLESCIVQRSCVVQAWYMHGNKEQAIGMLEKLAKDFPGSHAVALTHMELLHDDQPQESVSIAEQFLEATEALAKERPSTLHAAVLAEACVSYVAVGALGDALDALKNAMAVFKQLEDNAKQNAAAAKAKRAARHSSVSETVAVRPDVSGNGASSHSDVVADVAHAMAEPDIVDEKLESIMKEEAELWRRAAGPSFLCRARLRAPKLAVASAVHAAKLEDGWLKTRIAAASIALSQALIPHDARRARLLARLAVRSGKLQPEAHNAAAQAYIALRDFTRANRHVAAGFRMFPNHTGLLRTFARILREQGRMQDAVLVATYAHDVAGKGPTQVSSAVCEGFNSIRASELGV